MKTDDNFDIEYRCKACHIDFASKRSQVTHFMEHHLPKINTWPYECDCCKKKHDLLLHVVTHHHDKHFEITFSCKRCMEEFTSRDEAYDHVCIARCFSCGARADECDERPVEQEEFEEETLEVILENARNLSRNTRFWWD